MPEEIFFLNRKDRDILDELKKWWQSRGKYERPRGFRPQPNEEDDVGTYLAHVPDGGIAALTSNTTGTGTGTVVDDDVPGYAECEIYKLLQISDTPGDVRIVPAGFSRTVYNTSTDEIEPDSWAIISQDNFGTWWVVDKAGIICGEEERVTNVCFDGTNLTVEYSTINTCTGEVLSKVCVTNPTLCCAISPTCCPGVQIPSTLCVNYHDFHVNNPNFITLFGSHAWQITYLNGHWSLIGTGPGYINNIDFWCDGSTWKAKALAESTFDFGQPTLTTNSIDNNYVPPLYFTCNPLSLTFPLIGTGTEGGSSCLMTISLPPCIDYPGTGTGTGTSGGGNTNSTGCCTSGLPSTLHVTVMGGTGPTCASGAGTYLLTWESSTNSWVYSSGSTYLSNMRLSCNIGVTPNVWVLSVSLGGDSGSATHAATCTLPIDFTVDLSNCLGLLVSVGT